MNNSRGLGRGLASLIPDSALELDDAPRRKEKLIRVPLDQVRPNPEQPRTEFDSDALESLADSIREHGILNPIVARRDGGAYTIIAGERRFRAAALAGLSEVPLVVRTSPDAKEQLELALVENLQRADLDPIEAALGYDRLMNVYSMTQDQVAKRVGKKRSTVANALRLLKLPAFVHQALRDGRISAGHARALIPLADSEDDLRQTLAQVISRSLNVRATERLVNNVNRKPKAIRMAEREDRKRTYDYATQLLTTSLRTPVQIKEKANGGGAIVIQYANAEELERLVQSLRSAP